MANFEQRYVTGAPLTWYLVSAQRRASKNWMRLMAMVSENPTYAPGGVLAVYSENELEQARMSGNPVEIRCLTCLLHILWATKGIREVVLDGLYTVKVRSWRAPCETTAVFSENGSSFYLDGCGPRGVLWCRGDEVRCPVRCHRLSIAARSTPFVAVWAMAVRRRFRRWREIN